jgi:uncharacterized OB-fold protein
VHKEAVTNYVSAYPGQNSLDHQIVEDLGDGPVLVASRCPVCSTVRYPPRELCPNDLTVMQTIPVSRQGILHEAVRVELAPVGFTAPYWIAHVDMPEAVRIYAPLRWDGAVAPVTGQAVEYSLGVARTEPEEIIGPIFHRVPQAAA